MKILHVVESFGAGTQTALASYVASVPEFEHHLVRGFRAGEEVDEAEGYATDFESVHSLGTGLAAVRSIRRAISDVEPDLLHLHSSLGGFYGRIANLRGPKTVYTPHCFAFERQDLRPSVRLAVQATEKLLARRTITFAACSQREAMLARRLNTKATVVFVPNVASVPPQPKAPESTPQPYVVAVGRLSPQKRPELFARLARATNEAHPDTSFIWVGDGKYGRDDLEREGVSVSGWIPHDEVAGYIANASAVVHTGAWEGFPMVVLEAIALRTPVIAFESPALNDGPAHAIVHGPNDAARRIGEILASKSASAENLASWDLYLQPNNRATQRDALLRAYGVGTET